MTRTAAFDQLRRVRNELNASRHALSEVLRLWDDAALHPPADGLTPRDMRLCSEHLDLTYVLRLFAAFEALVRDYWRLGIGRDTRPDLEPLLDSIARRRGMDEVTRNAVQELRVFRNRIMHEDLRVLRFAFSECASRFARFVSWLPQEW